MSKKGPALKFILTCHGCKYAKDNPEDIEDILYCEHFKNPQIIGKSSYITPDFCPYIANKSINFMGWRIDS